MAQGERRAAAKKTGGSLSAVTLASKANCVEMGSPVLKAVRALAQARIACHSSLVCRAACCCKLIRSSFFQALFHLIADCICFALWAASFAAPWRIPASLNRVGAKISGKGFRKASQKCQSCLTNACGLQSLPRGVIVSAGSRCHDFRMFLHSE